jgi:hypothetical protein
METPATSPCVKGDAFVNAAALGTRSIPSLCESVL